MASCGAAVQSEKESSTGKFFNQSTAGEVKVKSIFYFFCVITNDFDELLCNNKYPDFIFSCSAVDFSAQYYFFLRLTPFRLCRLV